MIIAIKNDKFGVVDKITELLLGLSMKILRKLVMERGHLFEVSQDGKKYFYGQSIQ